MFPLNKSTRCRFLVALFGMTCILPTIGTVLFACWFNSDWYRQSHQQFLTEVLGLKTTVASVSHLTPNITLYRDVQLADPLTNQVLAKIRLLEIKTEHNETLIIASQPQLFCKSESRWKELGNRILNQPSNNRPRYIELWADQLSCTFPTHTQSFENVVGWLDSQAKSPLLGATFRLPGSKSKTDAHLELTLQSEKEQQITWLKFKTGDDFFPAETILPMAECERWLGSSAQFQGDMTFCQTKSHTSNQQHDQLTCSGTWQAIDLSRLVQNHFPHQLTGKATLQLEKVEFSDGRLTSASGKLSAGPGKIGPSLIAACQEQLSFEQQFIQGGQLAHQDDYHRIGFAFTIDQDSMLLQGTCPHIEGACLLASGFVLTPKPQSVPIVNIAKTLSPANQVVIPATRETDQVLRWLALPSIVPPQNTTSSVVNQPSQERLRIGKITPVREEKLQR